MIVNNIVDKNIHRNIQHKNQKRVKRQDKSTKTCKMAKRNRKIRIGKLKQTLSQIDKTLRIIEKSKQSAWKTIREFREKL